MTSTPTLKFEKAGSGYRVTIEGTLLGSVYPDSYRFAGTTEHVWVARTATEPSTRARLRTRRDAAAWLAGAFCDLHGTACKDDERLACGYFA